MAKGESPRAPRHLFQAELADVYPVRTTLRNAGFLLLFSGVSAALGAADTPVAFPASRYEKILAKSPFAVATPVAPVVQGPKFYDNLKVRGVARISGKNMVTIMNRETALTFPLFDGKPSEDGILLVSVDWSPELYKSKVLVKKGPDEGVLEWDTQASQAVQVAPPQPGMPGVPGAPRPPGAAPGMPANRLPAGVTNVPRPGQPACRRCRGLTTRSNRGREDAHRDGGHEPAGCGARAVSDYRDPAAHPDHQQAVAGGGPLRRELFFVGFVRWIAQEKARELILTCHPPSFPRHHRPRCRRVADFERPPQCRAYAANERLNVALVGVGGRGKWFVDTIPRMEKVVAVCDVNDQKIAEAFRHWEERGRRYADSPHDWERDAGGRVPAAAREHGPRRSATSARCSTRWAGDRRGRRGHARPHPRRGLGRGDPGRQARLLREAAHAHGARVARAARAGPRAQGGHLDGQPGHVQRAVPPGPGADPRRHAGRDQGSARVEQRRRGRPQGTAEGRASPCRRTWTGTCGSARRPRGPTTASGCSGTAGASSAPASSATGPRTAPTSASWR